MDRSIQAPISGTAYKLFLGVMVAVTAALASLIIVVLVGPFCDDGETWMSWGYAWWFSLPAIVFAGVLSPFAVRWYQRSMGFLGWIVAFMGHAIAVAIVGIGLTWVLFAVID